MSFVGPAARRERTLITVPMRAQRALGLAGLVAVALVTCWYAAFHNVTLARADAHAYFAFLGLSQNHYQLAGLARWVADLCLPSPFVLLAAVPVIVALVRRRWVLALGILVMMPAAIGSSELLKPLLAAPRPALGIVHTPIGADGSWPSGHSTAAMILAMACLLASPARWRPFVALAGTLFSLAVIYAVLTLGWHYPSDALGGIMVASIWTLLTVAAVVTVESHYGPDLSRLNSLGGEPRTWLAHMPSLPALVGAAALPALVLLVARGPRALSYAGHHTAFIAALLAIAVLAALTLAFATAALNGAARAPRPAQR
jgi:membrane-associated phospholipid phosphatase